MKWTPEADAALKKVPFFVRKRVRAKVEALAAESGGQEVTIDDMHAARKQYLTRMEEDVKGYRIDSCFGPGGCPNRANDSLNLVRDLEALFRKEDLLGFLKQQVAGSLKFHHEFSVSISDCPNACSQPQIRDIGIIGAAWPEVSDQACSMCGQCVDACREGAVLLDEDLEKPIVAWEKCLSCGKCTAACPTGALSIGGRGFRVLLGGKLGRHPRLASELPGVYTEDEVLKIVKACIAFYKQHSKNGMRFAELAARDWDGLMTHLKPVLKSR